MVLFLSSSELARSALEHGPQCRREQTSRRADTRQQPRKAGCREAETNAGKIRPMKSAARLLVSSPARRYEVAIMPSNEGKDGLARLMKNMDLVFHQHNDSTLLVDQVITREVQQNIFTFTLPEPQLRDGLKSQLSQHVVRNGYLYYRS